MRPCRQESQTWGQTTVMLRAAAVEPRAAIMVERGSVRWTAMGVATGRLSSHTPAPALVGERTAGLARGVIGGPDP